MSNRRRRQRTLERGFTLLELLMVVVIITILSFVAYPALQTFAGRNRDVNAATYLTRTVNRARDQAKRRNRAMALVFDGFTNAAPAGLLTIREGNNNSCLDLGAGIAENSTQVLRVPFGHENVGQGIDIDYEAVEDNVGLLGWRVSSADDAIKDGPLNLCVAPDGSVHTISGGLGAVNPVDRVRVVVQAFERGNGGAWAVIGPPRKVEISFSGGARMGVD